MLSAFFAAIIAVIIAFAVRQLTPDTWGEIGYFRAEGLKDILSQHQVYQSQKTCAPCHDVYDIREKGVHYAVEKAVKNNPG
jgi:hypothetical protein